MLSRASQRQMGERRRPVTVRDRLQPTEMFLTSLLQRSTLLFTPQLCLLGFRGPDEDPHMVFRQLFHLLIEVPNLFYLMSKDIKVMLYTSVVRTPLLEV